MVILNLFIYDIIILLYYTSYQLRRIELDRTKGQVAKNIIIVVVITSTSVLCVVFFNF